MERSELIELHYITPIDNVPSILGSGILSYARANSINHRSIAMNEIQSRRAKISVPGGKNLHEYVNLYFCARNPMMYKRREQHTDLCVLRIMPDIIDRSGVVITDSNASGDYVRFGDLSIVNRILTYADDWRDPEVIQYYRKKAAKCAEVLVPDVVEPYYVIGAYFSTQEAMNNFQRLNMNLAVTVNSHMFFR